MGFGLFLCLDLEAEGDGNPDGRAGNGTVFSRRGKTPLADRAQSRLIQKVVAAALQQPHLESSAVFTDIGQQDDGAFDAHAVCKTGVSRTWVVEVRRFVVGLCGTDGIVDLFGPTGLGQNYGARWGSR